MVTYFQVAPHYAQPEMQKELRVRPAECLGDAQLQENLHSDRFPSAEDGLSTD